MTEYCLTDGNPVINFKEKSVQNFCKARIWNKFVDIKKLRARPFVFLAKTKMTFN